MCSGLPTFLWEHSGESSQSLGAAVALRMGAVAIGACLAPARQGRCHQSILLRGSGSWVLTSW